MIDQTAWQGKPLLLPQATFATALLSSGERELEHVQLEDSLNTRCENLPILMFCVRISLLISYFLEILLILTGCFNGIKMNE